MFDCSQYNKDIMTSNQHYLASALVYLLYSVFLLFFFVVVFFNDQFLNIFVTVLISQQKSLKLVGRI